MSSTIYLSSQVLDERSLVKMVPYLSCWNELYADYLMDKAGQEHYKLLSEISHQLNPNTKIADIGSFYGASALALASCEKVHVTTYDIAEFIPQPKPECPTPLSRSNIIQKIMPGKDDIEYLCQCDFILLDVDPHDGKQEQEILDLLIQHNFRGILCCDDINMCNEMKTFWNNVPANLKKIDVTHLGHWTGTGMIIFDPSYIDIYVSPFTPEINIVNDNIYHNGLLDKDEIINALRHVITSLQSKSDSQSNILDSSSTT